MYLKYGNYTHAAAEAAVVIGRQTLENAAGVAYGYVERWDISGFLQASDPASLTVELSALERAYRLPGQTAVLLLPDGVTESAHKLDTNLAIGGVRVRRFDYPVGQGGEYSSYRRYRIALEAQFDNPAVATGLLSFDEVVQFVGGGPRYVHIETLSGLPQKQLVHQATVYRATQSGRAVGYVSYPAVPPPLWPADELPERRTVLYRTPRRSGTAQARALTEFEVTWSYTFESARPLRGRPHAWLGT